MLLEFELGPTYSMQDRFNEETERKKKKEIWRYEVKSNKRELERISRKS